MGLSVGLSSLISCRLGEKNIEEANAVASHGIVYTTIFWIAFLFFGIFGSEVFANAFSDTPALIMPAVRLQLKESSVKVFELAPPKTSRPMFKRGDSGAKDGGNKMPEMPVPKVVEVMIKGIKRNKFEILPGMSKMLKLAGRFTL